MREPIDYKAQYEEFSKKAEIVTSQLREDRDRLLNALNEIRAEIEDTLYVDSLIFTELWDFKNGKIDDDEVIEEFNRVTRAEVLKIIDKYAKNEE